MRVIQELDRQVPRHIKAALPSTINMPALINFDLVRALPDTRPAHRRVGKNV